MHIVGLQVENIKRVTAVEIKPSGNLVQITGRNGQGKSSILDAIWWAIAGAKNIQTQPIRAGQEKARIRLDLGELIVERKFTRKDDTTYTTTITVSTVDGARHSRPQEMLDSFLGALTFDPLTFANLDSKQQVMQLRSLVPGLEFSEIEREIADSAERRADLNRRVKECRAQSAAIVVPADAPVAAIDEDALITQLTSAAAHNGEVQKARDRLDQCRAGLAKKRARMEEIQAEYKALQAECADLGKVIDETTVPETVDVEEVRAELDRARAANALLAKAKAKADLERQALETEVAAGKLTAQIGALHQKKADAIASAKLPVPGLSFGETGVTLDGLPFDQASDAQRLRASVAIAMAMNPELKVIRIRDGSLLDDDGMKLLSEMAATQGYQIWIERVDSTGKTGFVIEDGALKIAEAAA